MDAKYSLPKRLIPTPVDTTQLVNILTHIEKTYHTTIPKLLWEQMPVGMMAVAKYTRGALRALRSELLSELLPDAKNLETQVEIPSKLNGDHLYSGTIYIVGTVVCDDPSVDVVEALRNGQSDLPLRFISSAIVSGDKVDTSPLKQKELLSNYGLPVVRHGVIYTSPSLIGVGKHMLALCDHENDSRTRGIVVRIIASGYGVKLTACVGKQSWFIPKDTGSTINDALIAPISVRTESFSGNDLVPGKYALVGNFDEAKSALKQKLKRANCTITTRVVPGCVGAFIGTGVSSGDLNNIRRLDVVVMNNRLLSTL